MKTGVADAIADSLELLAERAGDPAAAIYARLFAAFPETEERFARDVTGSIRAEMLTMVFDCLMDPGGPYQANLVRAERVNHDGFGTPAEVFDRFFWIVMETCRDLLGPDWTPAFEAAWTTRIKDMEAATR
ncbi:globin [uncultured Phenylobacterium sp.]|uniref:globin n=1 Tax=uncultured Phenylobacterium sp. TaxID=349273 RepID=UPI0025D76EA7|nr:globin [uncultured Phenylobacterium sp.]